MMTTQFIDTTWNHSNTIGVREKRWWWWWGRGCGGWVGWVGGGWGVGVGGGGGGGGWGCGGWGGGGGGGGGGWGWGWGGGGGAWVDQSLTSAQWVTMWDSLRDFATCPLKEWWSFNTLLIFFGENNTLLTTKSNRDGGRTVRSAALWTMSLQFLKSNWSVTLTS